MRDGRRSCIFLGDHEPIGYDVQGLRGSQNWLEARTEEVVISAGTVHLARSFRWNFGRIFLIFGRFRHDVEDEGLL